MRNLAIASLAVLGPALAAQTTSQYSPAQYEKVEGYTSMSYPLCYYSSSTSFVPQVRYMQVHDDLNPMAIKRMTFRRDSRSSEFWNTPAYYLDMELMLSTAATTAATMSTTWQTNHGSDLKTVISRKRVNIAPGVVIPGTRPQPDAFYQVIFDTVFPYTKSGSLCWEMKVHGSNYAQKAKRAFYLDRAYSYKSSTTTRFYGFRDYMGRGCYGSFPYHSDPYSVGYINYSSGNLTFYAYSYYLPPGKSAAILSLGFSSRTMGGVPLPFDLTPLGATGCRIYHSMDVNLPITTDVSGYARYPQSGNVTFPYNNNTSLDGKSMYVQAVSLDPRGNQAGVVTSRAYQTDIPVVFPNGLPVQYIYRAGSTALTAATGSGASSTSRYGVIVGFHSN